MGARQAERIWPKKAIKRETMEEWPRGLGQLQAHTAITVARRRKGHTRRRTLTVLTRSTTTGFNPDTYTTTTTATSTTKASKNGRTRHPYSGTAS